MDEARAAAADTGVPSTGQSHPGEHVYPDKLDAGTLRVAGVCLLAAFMSILDTTVVSVAQRTFIVEFGSTQAVVGWTMTGYMLAMTTVIPITGWAADRFGTKRIWMGSVLAFVLGSLLCALAPNILLLIAFRVVQGIGGGMLMPLGFMILTRVAGPRRLGRMMAVLGIPMLLGPLGGPTLGGLLISAFGWPWIFLVNLPIGFTALIMATFVFPKDRPTPSEAFDLVGVLLLSPGLAALLFGVSSIPGRGTVADRHVLIPVGIGLALIVAFVLHAWYRVDHPLIDLRLFRNFVFTQANVTLLVFAIAFYGTGLLLPGYLQQVLHQTPLQSGLHMVPNGLGAMLTLPFAGAFMDRRGPGKCVLLGLTVIVIGLVTFTFAMATQAAYLPMLMAGLMIVGMGMGCTTTPLSGAAMQTLAPREIARGSTLLSVNQQVGGSIGTALMSMMLTNQVNRSENIAAANKVAAEMTRRPVNPALSSAALHDLSHAYAVVFAVAVVLMALSIIPATFLPKRPAG
ncbi:MFS transporter [Mycobacterium angelicum]|uniref:MFS transporter n=2 Tax=Mycobacterium angelicum TaxID=470074 RepID=A0A1X0A459_MYCAN|nr:MFS transporter [Mycobacterium angelicum]